MLYINQSVLWTCCTQQCNDIDDPINQSIDTVIWFLIDIKLINQHLYLCIKLADQADIYIKIYINTLINADQFVFFFGFHFNLK